MNQLNQEGYQPQVNKDNWFARAKAKGKSKGTRSRQRGRESSKSSASSLKRKLPSIGDQPIFVLGIDQAPTWTGFCGLYLDPKSEKGIEVIPAHGDYIDKICLIQVVTKGKNEPWPDCNKSVAEYREKIDLMKKLFIFQLQQMGYITEEKEPLFFAIIESIHIQQYNVLKSMLKFQTILALEIQDLCGYNCGIYEYTAAEAKSAVGAGRSKDSVTDRVNMIFGLDLPTKSTARTKTEYEHFSHISDALALAKAFMNDVLRYDINLFEGVE